MQEGLAENEKLIVTDIAAAVPGMPLRIVPAEKQNTPSDIQVSRQGEGR